MSKKTRKNRRGKAGKGCRKKARGAETADGTDEGCRSEKSA